MYGYSYKYERYALLFIMMGENRLIILSFGLSYWHVGTYSSRSYRPTHAEPDGMGLSVIPGIFGRRDIIVCFKAFPEVGNFVETAFVRDFGDRIVGGGQ